jgi:hypothetical protein
MERAKQLQARVSADERIIDEYYKFRNEELPKILKGMTAMTGELTALFKEYEVFLSKVHIMKKEDVEQWRKEMDDRLNQVKLQVDTSMKTALDHAVVEVNRIKDLEQQTQKQEVAANGGSSQ